MKTAGVIPQLREKRENFSIRRAQGLLAAAACATAAFVTGCNSQNFGVPAANNTFGQTPTYTHQVDILWVIDNSGSMGVGTASSPSRQQQLADQIPTFVTALNQTGLDYQMAVTTMDMSPSGPEGRFIYQDGTSVMMNSTTPNLLPDLEGRIDASPGGGSPVTRGMDAVIAALSGPLAASGGGDAGFLRQNAILVLIFLTDENDASSAAASNDVSFLDGVRPPFMTGDHGWVAEYMGVMPNDPNCTTSAWDYSSPGTRYINLANESGGAAESICSGNLASALSGVTAQILSVTTAYPLSGTPQVSTIVVTVNGQTVPQNATNGWTYDSTDNTIRFNGTAVPPVGASISVTFTPATLN